MLGIYAKCFVGFLVVNLDPYSLVALGAVKLTAFVPIFNVEPFSAMRAGSVKTHHSPAFSAHRLHSAKPSGIEITAMPHFRQGDKSMLDLSSSSESLQSSDLASAITWSIISHRLHFA
jgi:hypothetical protein